MSTKAFVINNLAEALSITKKAAAEIFSTMSTITFNSLSSSGLAVIPGVGRIKVKAKPARTGRNPKTGDPVLISERNVLKLSTSKLAKIRINVK